MKLAYTVEQSIELHISGRYVDLHNDYELVSALRDGVQCYIHFVKRNAAWVKALDPSHLALVFEQVDYFQVSEGLQMPTSIEEIGFKEPEDFDMDWFMQQPEVEPVHTLFRLEDDQFIRIGAERSLLLANWSAISI